MPRFADSREIVANEDVEPIDEIYRKYKEKQTHSSPVEHRIDIAEKQGQHLLGLPFWTAKFSR